MKTKEFDMLARKLFGEVLASHGFSQERSMHCTFYRQVSDDIYHFVMPDLGTRGMWFDVKIFPSSPRIDPGFVARFPDALGLPTDIYSYLNKWTGIGSEQQSFNCESAQQLREVFEAEVKPLLVSKGLPYLDRIKSVADMLPLIRHKLFLGFALNHVGDLVAARSVMEAERARLEKLRQANPSNRDIDKNR